MLLGKYFVRIILEHNVIFSKLVRILFICQDLQWIQVSDSKEAYRLLKLGVKHQSVAFTKLNNASSRR